MTLHSILALSLALAGGLKSAPTESAQAPATNKVEIVSVTGCLREQGAGNWVLVAATDPVPSIANQAPAAELPKAPPAGKNTFRLIGVGEFNLGQHRDHTMVIRGLFIKATPVSRINMTSSVEAAASCIAGAPK
jgi:hypothetical protein